MTRAGLEEAADIVVVDDERVVCQSCERILGDEGHRVTTFQDPLLGIEFVREKQPDIAIVDLKMPGIGGIEFLRQVKAVSPGTEVMIVTGFAEIQTAVQAMKLGAFDYVPKPFGPDQLAIAVAKMQQRRRLQAENRELRDELQKRYRFESVIGRSARMQAVYRLVERVAPTDSTVLIRGDSGTGKELIARAIHHNRPRRAARFVAVDCGALSETVLESEMFGHVKGAFTGATETRKGFFAVADGGTLFLDEIGNISLAVQTRLLRVLQEREFKPVGASMPVATDIRLIAATNRNLEAMAEAGEFREELYYRLNIVPIELPRLRERAEDIPELAMHFLKKHRDATHATATSIAPGAVDALLAYGWPGNVRELENAIERALVLCTGEQILAEHLPLELRRAAPGAIIVGAAATWEELKDQKRRLLERSVAELERQFLVRALEQNDGNITRAAEAVGMLRPNFQALMKRHDVSRESLLR
ncbi:MAG: sigma-54 dependent transcriptional regulator [Planctomycetota bacterium]